jgi:serine/threonine protein phosphatase PrpC
VAALDASAATMPPTMKQHPAPKLSKSMTKTAASSSAWGSGSIPTAIQPPPPPPPPEPSEPQPPGPLSWAQINARIECSDRSEWFALGGGLGLRFAYLTQRGYYPDALNKANQDSYRIVRQFNGVADQLLFGVFDGHGGDGDKVSGFVRDQFERELKRQLSICSGDFETAYAQTFLALNRQASKRHFDSVMSGTTAICAFFHGTHLTIANVGDSRAVVGSEHRADSRDPLQVKASLLSMDQTPFRKDERERIKAAGGTIMSAGQIEGFAPLHEEWNDNQGEAVDETGDPPRVWAMFDDGSLQGPGCAFTRSIGDSWGESVGVYAEPELTVYELSARDKCVVLASDGVWEFLTNQAVVDMLLKFDDPLDGCRAVVAESYRLWLQYDTRTDDITIICAFVEADPASAPPPPDEGGGGGGGGGAAEGGGGDDDEPFVPEEEEEGAEVFGDGGSRLTQGDGLMMARARRSPNRPSLGF